MKTEFKKISLDYLNYSIVWEAHETLYEALSIKPNDHVLVITSAGDNALNALLKRPASVLAIDINRVQNKLLQFKKYIILNFPYSVYYGLLGLGGRHEVKEAWSVVQPSLNGEDKIFWESFFDQNQDGILSSGKLESYVLGFINTLSTPLQNAIKEVVHCETLEEQISYFDQHINTKEFIQKFLNFYNNDSLGKGRDPKLFKYTGNDTGELSYNGLVRQSKILLWKNDFHWRFFFLGPLNIPQQILPPSYQLKNYLVLRKLLNRLEIVEGEVINYMTSKTGKKINKASLSNVFEYVAPEEFQYNMERLFNSRSKKLRLVYWNLFQHQAVSQPLNIIDKKISDKLSHRVSIFFFDNVYVLDNGLV